MTLNNTAHLDMRTEQLTKLASRLNARHRELSKAISATWDDAGNVVPPTVQDPNDRTWYRGRCKGLTEAMELLRELRMDILITQDMANDEAALKDSGF